MTANCHDQMSIEARMKISEKKIRVHHFFNVFIQIDRIIKIDIISDQILLYSYDLFSNAFASI